MGSAADLLRAAARWRHGQSQSLRVGRIADFVNGEAPARNHRGVPNPPTKGRSAGGIVYRVSDRGGEEREAQQGYAEGCEGCLMKMIRKFTVNLQKGAFRSKYLFPGFCSFRDHVSVVMTRHPCRSALDEANDDGDIRHECAGDDCCHRQHQPPLPANARKRCSKSGRHNDKVHDGYHANKERFSTSKLRARTSLERTQMRKAVWEVVYSVGPHQMLAATVKRRFPICCCFDLARFVCFPSTRY